MQAPFGAGMPKFGFFDGLPMAAEAIEHQFLGFVEESILDRDHVLISSPD